MTVPRGARTPNTEFKRARQRLNLSQDDLVKALRQAGWTSCEKRTIQRYESGEVTTPLFAARRALTSVFTMGLAQLGFIVEEDRGPLGLETVHPPKHAVPGSWNDEIQAAELARRVSANDVSEETLVRLELAADELAMAYSQTPPHQLLDVLRQHLEYVSHLMESRATLTGRRRLIGTGGWLSLLAATVHIDLNQISAARARLSTAASLAHHISHTEMAAWCYETEAWHLLTEGHYQQAIQLSRTAQHLAPAASSAAIQATAQEGRAWARLGQSRETYAAIDRVNALVSSLEPSNTPEHHYRYDPDKSVAYVATTLAWLGDPAAEPYAREIITRLTHRGTNQWPRRLASANLDLSLSLLASGDVDEAHSSALEAITSGRIAPSNYWRAAEVVHALEARKQTEAHELREAYEHLTRTPSSHGITKTEGPGFDDVTALTPLDSR